MTDRVTLITEYIKLFESTAIRFFRIYSLNIARVLYRGVDYVMGAAAAGIQKDHTRKDFLSSPCW